MRGQDNYYDKENIMGEKIRFFRYTDTNFMLYIEIMKTR